MSHSPRGRRIDSAWKIAHDCDIALMVVDAYRQVKQLHLCDFLSKSLTSRSQCLQRIVHLICIQYGGAHCLLQAQFACDRLSQKSEDNL